MTLLQVKSEKYKGNPAAVCLPDNELEVGIMQKIATEIGFSETAFIRQIKDNTYSIRFFTPKIEIPLCGHATLASSKIVFYTTSFDSIIFVNCNNVELFVEKAIEAVIDKKTSSNTEVFEEIVTKDIDSLRQDMYKVFPTKQDASEINAELTRTIYIVGLEQFFAIVGSVIAIICFMLKK